MRSEPSDLQPYLEELMKQTGILFKVVERDAGGRLVMPDAIQTQQDKHAPIVYRQLKMALVTKLALSFVDGHFPNLVQTRGHKFRGEMAARLAFEVYRMLTDGVSIDALRIVIGEPNPSPKGAAN